MTPHTFIVDGIWARQHGWDRMKAAIEQHVGPTEIHEFDSSGRRTFESLGEELAIAARKVGGPVNLVGFSMGGLIVRAARMIDGSLPVNRAVFMNSPHHGSLLAYLLPLPGVLQMRPGSPFMWKLQACDWNLPTLVVWNTIDQMVIPPTSTRWKAATEHACCGVPLHLWPAMSKGIRNRVVRFLAS